MKTTIKTLFVLIFLALTLTTNAQQNKSKNSDIDFGKWLFVKSDKPIQVRYKQVKIENNIGYYQLQFRINFDDEVFCKSAQCAGYLMMFAYLKEILVKLHTRISNL